jgi:hypothetical protein
MGGRDIGSTICFDAGGLVDHCTGVPSYPAASVPFGVFLRSICSDVLCVWPPITSVAGL